MIVFDFCGVLGDWPTAGDRAALEDLAGRPGRGFWHDYWLHRPPYDIGELSEREYWARVVPRADRSQAAALEALDVACWSRPRTAVLALAAGLAEPPAILSNAPAGLARTIDTAPWARAFAPRLFSADLGVAKPDPAAYLALTERVRMDPHDVIFIDDRAENVAAACEAGLRGIQFTDLATLSHLLREGQQPSARG